MSDKKTRDIVAPILHEQTLYQLQQIKIFVDKALSDIAVTTFENETEKITYLLNVLYGIRDFVFSQTVENSVRVNLTNKIKILEEEISAGNDIEQVELS